MGTVGTGLGGRVMGNVYFVQTEHYRNGGYQAHWDFWRLVELSDYPIIRLSDIDIESDNTYIITPANGEWSHGFPVSRARIILYQLEWNVDGEHDTPGGVTEVWCGDKWHAEKHGYRYVPLGSHSGLNEAYGQQFPKLYDMAFMGYRAPSRRADLLRELKYINVKVAPDAWGVARSELLMQSKCMGIIHQWGNIPAVAPLRMCIAAAHSLAVITETVNDAGIFGYSDLMQSSYPFLPQFIKQITRDMWYHLQDKGHNLYQKLCVDMPFRASIERAL